LTSEILGARHFLLDNVPKGTSVSLDYDQFGSACNLIPAGSFCYNYINKKLLAADDGLHTGMKVSISLRQVCTDLDREAKIPSSEKNIETLSSRFSFNMNADEGATALLRASNVSTPQVTSNVACKNSKFYEVFGPNSKFQNRNSTKILF